MTHSPENRGCKNLGTEIIYSAFVDYAGLVNRGVVQEQTIQFPFRAGGRYQRPDQVQDLLNYIFGDGLDATVEFFALRNIDTDMLKEAAYNPEVLKRLTQ